MHLSLCVLVNTWGGSGRHARAPNDQANQNQEKHPPDCGEKCRPGLVLSSNIISRKSWKKALMEREQACNADWCLSLLMSLFRVSHTAADSHYDILQSCSSWIYEYVSADSCFWCCCATFLCFWKKERYCSLIMSISVPHTNGFVVFVQTCWWLITDHVNINNRDFFVFRFIHFFI